jgi:hypothetical protein
MVKYETFSNIYDLKELTDSLDKNEIAYKIEDHPIIMTSTLSLGDNFKEFTLYLDQQDFENAKNLHFSLIDLQIQNLDKSYYLFDYSSDELRNVLRYPDEWNKFDYRVAQYILSKRGEGVEQAKIEEIEQERIKINSHPEKDPIYWIVLGYSVAFAGGLLGLIIGIHLRTHRKTLLNGERVHGYTYSAQQHGTIILCISIIVFVITMVNFVLKLE